MEVLEDEEQRLPLALAKEEPLDGVERALASLRRVQGLPGGVVDRDVEEREERGCARRRTPRRADEPRPNRS
jgi:hypothetical protein